MNKVYVIGYQLKDGKFYFYKYTCKFLSERVEISEVQYDELRPKYTIKNSRNNYHSGEFFK